MYVYIHIYTCIYIYICIVNLPPNLPALICGPCRREEHLLVLEGHLRGWQDVGQDAPGKDANPPGEILIRSGHYGILKWAQKGPIGLDVLSIVVSASFFKKPDTNHIIYSEPCCCAQGHPRMVAIQWLNFFDLMRFWVCFCPLMLKDPPDLVKISEKCEEICVLDIINLQSMDGFPVFLSQFLSWCICLMFMSPMIFHFFSERAPVWCWDIRQCRFSILRPRRSASSSAISRSKAEVFHSPNFNLPSFFGFLTASIGPNGCIFKL